MQDLNQVFGEIDCVVDAAIHAHATERIVDMRGVADEESAAFAECAGDALVHAIKRGVSDFIAIDSRHDTAPSRLARIQGTGRVRRSPPPPPGT